MKHAAALGALVVTAGVATATQAAPFDWTGFYTGIYAGFAAGNEHNDQFDLLGCHAGGGGPGGCTATTSTATGTISVGNSGPAPISYSPKDFNGFIGGVHTGYNVQVDRLVLGVEGDLDYAPLEKSELNTYYSVSSNRVLDFETLWQGSVRVRAGFTASERLLLFATGGVAVADGKLLSGTSSTSFVIPAATDTNIHIGWTAGIGADYAFTDHWIGRFEVRYSDFLDRPYQTYDGTVNVGWNQTVSTIGLSYKF